MDILLPVNIAFYNKMLDNIDNMIKENGPHYTIGALKTALAMAIVDLEKLKDEQ